jgi:hypothetical protein
VKANVNSFTAVGPFVDAIAGVTGSLEFTFDTEPGKSLRWDKMTVVDAEPLDIERYKGRRRGRCGPCGGGS